MRAMRFPFLVIRTFWLAVLLGMASHVSAYVLYPETIGLTAMRRERPGITGAGIYVAQVEGEESPGAFEVDASIAPSVQFVYTSTLGSSSNFPNSVGSVSIHASTVGFDFYGAAAGIAIGVPRVDNYEVNYFINSIVTPKAWIPSRVVNQSYTITEIPSTTIDPIFDSYAARYNVLFVSGMANEPVQPYAPGTCYNGIGVGIFSTNNFSSVGPTTDGRAKPDMVAPEPSYSSLSTPHVAGAATMLLQAAAANDGGAGTAQMATNSAVIKALLMNGAVKMPGWTNGPARPLDARWGAGALNMYNSDLQLRGSRWSPIALSSVTTNAPHPPTADPNSIGSLRGWNSDVIASTATQDRVAHYYFSLPTNSAAYSATATLVWKKGSGVLTNLDLFLYNTANNAFVTNSISTVDNVEHIFIPNLPAGRYDLQVFKTGGTNPGAETYALAFDFSPAKLSVARSSTNAVVSWPASPAGFVLQSTSTLTPPITWQDVPVSSFLSNAMNVVILPASSSMQFFRLFRP
jgi:hypothetical protein